MTTSESFQMHIVYDLTSQVKSEVLDRVKTVVAQSAFQIEAKAKAIVPVDTGNLKNSLTTVIEPSGIMARVGTNVEYAPHVEFGTRRASAQPYLFPSAEEVKPHFLEAMKKVTR